LHPLPPKEFSLSAVVKAKPHRPCSSSSASACRCALDREEWRGRSGGALCRRPDEFFFALCEFRVRVSMQRGGDLGMATNSFYFFSTQRDLAARLL
jgi:hypothetical protein